MEGNSPLGTPPDPQSARKLTLSVLKILAISGTRGSSGLGSQRSEQIESNTFDMVSAGDHCDLSMSRQMEPFEFMFGWYMRVVNATCKVQVQNLGLLAVGHFIEVVHVYPIFCLAES